jgi:hypothetical protein
MHSPSVGEYRLQDALTSRVSSTQSIIILWLVEPFPEKPKGMPHHTYIDLFWEHHEAEMEHLAGMREWLDKLERKLG